MKILNRLMQNLFLVGFQKRLRCSCKTEAMEVFGALWELRFDLWAYTKKLIQTKQQTKKNPPNLVALVILCGQGKVMLQELSVFLGKKG